MSRLDDEDLSTAELIHRSGIPLRSLERYAQVLLPQHHPAVWKRGRELRWSYPQLLSWMEQVRAQGGRIGKGRKAPAETVAAAVPHELLAKLRAVGSRADLVEFRKDVMQATMEGRIPPAASSALARLAADLKKDLQELEKVGAQPEVMVSEQAATVARMIDGIVDGRRRAELLELVRRAAEEDAREYPAEDAAACARRLEERGLDAFGEPVAPAGGAG